MTAESLDAWSAEHTVIRGKLDAWNEKLPSLQALSEIACLIIRHRQTRRAMSWKSEITTASEQCDKVGSDLQQRRGKQASLQGLWQELTALQQAVTAETAEIRENLVQCAVQSSTPHGLQVYVDELKREQTRLTALTPRVDQLHTVGRQLMAEDTARMTEAQDAFTAVNTTVEEVQLELRERLSLEQSLAAQWQQNADCRASVSGTLQHAEPRIHAHGDAHDLPEALEVQQDLSAQVRNYNTLSAQVHKPRIVRINMNPVCSFNG